jgi:hypothetical protein
MHPYFPDKDFEKEIMMDDKKTRKEEFQVDGDKLVAKIKELVHEGNIRSIVIQNEEGALFWRHN